VKRGGVIYWGRTSGSLIGTRWSTPISGHGRSIAQRTTRSLLRNAVEQGADVREGAFVKRIFFRWRPCYRRGMDKSERQRGAQQRLSFVTWLMHQAGPASCRSSNSKCASSIRCSRTLRSGAIGRAQHFARHSPGRDQCSVVARGMVVAYPARRRSLQCWSCDAQKQVQPGPPRTMQRWRSIIWSASTTQRQ